VRSAPDSGGVGGSAGDTLRQGGRDDVWGSRVARFYSSGKDKARGKRRRKRGSRRCEWKKKVGETVLVLCRRGGRGADSRKISKEHKKRNKREEE